MQQQAKWFFGWVWDARRVTLALADGTVVQRSGLVVGVDRTREHKAPPRIVQPTTILVSHTAGALPTSGDYWQVGDRARFYGRLARAQLVATPALARDLRQKAAKARVTVVQAEYHWLAQHEIADNVVARLSQLLTGYQAQMLTLAQLHQHQQWFVSQLAPADQHAFGLLAVRQSALEQAARADLPPIYLLAHPRYAKKVLAATDAAEPTAIDPARRAEGQYRATLWHALQAQGAAARAVHRPFFPAALPEELRDNHWQPDAVYRALAAEPQEAQ